MVFSENIRKTFLNVWASLQKLQVGWGRLRKVVILRRLTILNCWLRFAIKYFIMKFIRISVVVSNGIILRWSLSFFLIKTRIDDSGPIVFNPLSLSCPLLIRLLSTDDFDKLEQVGHQFKSTPQSKRTGKCMQSLETFPFLAFCPRLFFFDFICYH